VPRAATSRANSHDIEEIAVFRPKNAKNPLRGARFVATLRRLVRKDKSPKGEQNHTWQQAQ
jgi:hypothetical protein